jgi:hypothetical protein
LLEYGELLTGYFGTASWACTHHDLWGPSWCSFLHACEEIEDREQSATKQGRCAERVGRVDGLTGIGRTAWKDHGAVRVFVGKMTETFTIRFTKKANHGDR